MARAVARPFRVATDRSVSVDGREWTLTVGEEAASLLDLREHLKTVSHVSLEGKLDINLPAFLDETQLDPSARFEALFMWECPATRRREVGARVPVVNSGVISGAFEVATDVLAERIRLERQIVLRQPGADVGPYVANRHGNMLWREHTPLSVDLEGSGGVFPTDVTSFSYPLASGAAWALQVDTSDLHAPVRANVRLVLNEEHADIAYLIAHERRDDRAKAVLSTMYWDCGRGLVTAALREEAFDLAAEYPEDSTGRALQSLVTTAFPETDLASIQELADSRPMEFETTLQLALQLLRGRSFRRYKTADPDVGDHSISADSTPAADVSPQTEVEGPTGITTVEEDDPRQSDGPVGVPPSANEIATYKQIRMIVGLSGVWLGTKEIESMQGIPQVPLLKDEARELIELILQIPEAGDKSERAAVVESYLERRYERLRN